MVMNVKNQLNFRDINKSCVLIITGSRILRAKNGRLLCLYSREGTFSSEVSPFIRLLYEPLHVCAQSDQSLHCALNR